MPTTVSIIQNLSCTANARATLPEPYTWDDVNHWCVQWDTLCITFKDGKETEIDLHSDPSDIPNWKRPASVEIRAVNEEGQ